MEPEVRAFYSASCCLALSGLWAYTKLHFRYYVRLRVFYDKISVGNIIFTCGLSPARCLRCGL